MEWTPWLSPVCLTLASLLASQALAQELITSWPCDCSGFSFHLPYVDWFPSGQNHATARQECESEGGTLVTSNTDFPCFREYTDYLYERFNLHPPDNDLWLAESNSTGCYGFDGCQIVNVHTCVTTLRFLCQKKVEASPTVPNVPNSISSAPSAPPTIRVNYICEEGYEAEGDQDFSECVGQKYWSVPDITCNAVSCPDLVAPSNGRLEVTDGFKFNSQARFTCNPGYSLDGDSLLHCKSNKTWNGSVPVCIPADCGQPPEVENSRLTVNQTTLGSIAMYECEEGYHDPEGISRFTAVCQETSMWNTSGIVCPIVNCGRPPTFPNADMDYSSTTYLTRIYYNCTTGYRQANESADMYQAVCAASGKWVDNNVDCIAVDCGIPPLLPNSDVEYTTTTYLSKATYACVTGYENSTFVHVATCTASRVWDAWNIGCQAVDCGIPPPKINSIVTFSSTTYQSTATYTCTDGHEPPPESQPFVSSCQATKEWQPVEVTCEATHCPELPVPENGFIAFSNGTAYKAVTVFGCVPGYQLTGDAALLCQLNKTWNGTMPQCSSEVQCPAIPAPENGNVTRLLGDSTDVNSVLLFTCNYGYKLNGSNTLVCTTTGFWTDEAPFCMVDEFAPTTPSPSGQNSLEPPTIASIVLAVVLGCILLLALFAAWRFKQRRRFLSFKIDDSDLTRPRYSTGSHQLTESSKYTGHGRKSESRKLLG